MFMDRLRCLCCIDNAMWQFRHFIKHQTCADNVAAYCGFPFNWNLIFWYQEWAIRRGNDCEQWNVGTVFRHWQVYSITESIVFGCLLNLCFEDWARYSWKRIPPSNKYERRVMKSGTLFTTSDGFSMPMVDRQIIAVLADDSIENSQNIGPSRILIRLFWHSISRCYLFAKDYHCLLFELNGVMWDYYTIQYFGEYLND